MNPGWRVPDVLDELVLAAVGVVVDAVPLPPAASCSILTVDIRLGF